MTKLSESIIFRKLRMKDQNRLYEIYSDKEAMKYRGNKPMESLKDARAYVNSQVLLKGEILTIRKAVESLIENELIGSIMYRFDENNKKECEIGYSIGRKFWGKGYGNEIVRMIIEILEQNNTTENVIAWSNKLNIASIKILKKNGFKRFEQNEEGSDNYLFQKRF